MTVNDVRKDIVWYSTTNSTTRIFRPKKIENLISIFEIKWEYEQQRFTSAYFQEVLMRFMK